MATKRKRVSKKSKKSWRKNVDISDVDNFLEDQRLEERLGIKFSDQKDEDLFQFDVTGQDENSEPVNITYKTHTPLKSFSLSKRLKEAELPKCFQVLEKRTAVPVAIQVTKRVNDNKINKKRLRRKILKKKILTNVKQSNDEEKTPRFLYNYDVWSQENKKNLSESNNSWLSSDTLRHNLQNTGKLKKLIPKTAHSKTSLLPAVESPHPGLSYNPSLKDHTEILAKVAEKESELIEEEKHLDRVTKCMFSQVTREQMEKNWISEMTAGLTASKSDSDEDDGEDYKAINPPVRNKKKNLQKKRKKREALLLKEKLKHEKIEKKKLSDIYKVEKFNESIDKKEQRILKKIEKRIERKKNKPYSTCVVGGVKYEEADIDFQMPEELPGNLRNIKTEGSILYDRFKSMQKRNILPPTIKRHMRKAKVKQYERKHTKMDWELNGFEPTKKKKNYLRNKSR